MDDPRSLFRLRGPCPPATDRPSKAAGTEETPASFVVKAVGEGARPLETVVASYRGPTGTRGRERDVREGVRERLDPVGEGSSTPRSGPGEWELEQDLWVL